MFKLSHFLRGFGITSLLARQDKPVYNLSSVNLSLLGDWENVGKQIKSVISEEKNVRRK